MRESTQIGKNVTGVQTSSEMIKRMKATETHPSFPNQGMNEIRRTYFREAEPIGSVPLPRSFKGIAKAGSQILKGKKPQTLIDKIGERLAFERTGVRLYDALLVKCDLQDEDFPVEELQRYRQEEMQHFHMLQQCLESLGADPTAVTPGADIATVASQGIISVITDPRTTISQSMEALLIAELVDNDSWHLLIDMAEKAGHDQMVEDFKNASQEEEEHLEGIRSIVKNSNLKDENLLS